MLSIQKVFCYLLVKELFPSLLSGLQTLSASTISLGVVGSFWTKAIDIQCSWKFMVVQIAS